jgi:asparagine synthase (glutamine-hydrolysing)
MRLPREWKLRNGQNKYLLRKLAYRHVPREILDRPKKGFEVPIGRWLRGPLKDWALEMCNNKALFEQVPISQDKVRALLHLHFSGERNAHPVIWAVLMLLNFAGNFRTCRQ